MRAMAIRNPSPLAALFMDPFRGFDALERAFLGEAAPVPAPFRTDVREEDGRYVLEAELPGFRKEDVSIVIEDGIMTLKASREESSGESKDGYIRRERRTGTFERSFGLDGIDEDAVSAECRDGVLYVYLPKLAPARPAARTVEIG